MTYKGFRTLQGVLTAGYASLIAEVITAKDIGIANDHSTEIFDLCYENKIKVRFRSGNDKMRTQYALAVSWRWMIPLSENTELIVLHDSLLPKYRGFSPLVNQLINGEKLIGVTALFASDNYDEGNIIYQASSRIEYPITIDEAMKIISDCYVKLANRILEQISHSSPLPSIPQSHEKASYSLWRDNRDYEINWQDDAIKISRFIDAVGFPYKGASCRINNKLARVIRSTPLKDVIIENRDVGKIIFITAGRPVVVCGQGLLRIDYAIYENGKPVPPLKKFRSRFN